jgi:hypothetical protein
MKITYHENPLRTTVELDENDRQVFWLKIKVEELQNRLFSANFHLTEGEKYFNLDRARLETNPEEYIKEDDQEKTTLDKRVDMLFDTYVAELLNTHIGDCTCFPCSCMKCHAEGILGVDTLKPFPGKHQLAKIDAAFSYSENGEIKQRSLDEALVYLKDYKVSRTKPESWKHSTQDDYEKYIPRWESETVSAYENLQIYAGIYLVNKALSI